MLSAKGWRGMAAASHLSPLAHASGSSPRLSGGTASLGGACRGARGVWGGLGGAGAWQVLVLHCESAPPVLASLWS